MQQLPSSGAVITDEIQLPRAETAPAAKSICTPSASHASMLWYVCGMSFEWGNTAEVCRVFSYPESLYVLEIYEG